MWKHWLSIAATSVMTLIGTQMLLASETTPRPSAQAGTPDIAAYQAVVGHTERSAKVAEFFGSLVAYRDLEDPNVWWYAPHYRLDPQTPASLVPRPGTVGIMKGLDAIFAKMDAKLLDKFDTASNKNFNNSMREAASAAATSFLEAGDESWSSDEDLKDDALGKVSEGMFLLDPEFISSAKAYFNLLLTRYGKPAKTDLTDEQFKYQMILARTYTTHELRLKIVRGFSAEEIDMLGEFATATGYKILALPIESEATIEPTHLSQANIGNDGEPAIRAPNDLNQLATGIASNGQIKFPASGAVVSVELNWDAFQGLSSVLGSGSLENPNYFLLPLEIKGRSLHQYTAQGLYRCKGRSVIDSELGLEFDKYSNDETFSYIPTRVINEVERDLYCSLDTPATGFDRALLEDLKPSVDKQFIDEFAFEVQSSKQMREQMLRHWIDEGRNQFFNYIPENLKKTYKSRVVESCWTEIKKKCASRFLGICLRTKKQEIPHCAPTVQWYEDYERETIPLHVMRKEKFQDFATKFKEYEVKSDTSHELHVPLTSGACIVGITDPMDSSRITFKPCLKWSDESNARDNAGLETIGGQATRLSFFELE